MARTEMRIKHIFLPLMLLLVGQSNGKFFGSFKSKMELLMSPIISKVVGASKSDDYTYQDKSLTKYGFENIIGSLGKHLHKKLKASRRMGDLLKGIAVGTRWCGSGNVAKQREELGEFEDTDKCCRAHDECPANINANNYSPEFNLSNDGHYTRSHCKCDGAFYTCLKETQSQYSNLIGWLYFNILGPRCFENTYDVIRCVKLENGRCLSHVFNGYSSRRYHWFDNPTFCENRTYPQYDNYVGLIKFNSYYGPQRSVYLNSSNTFPVVNGDDYMLNSILGDHPEPSKRHKWG